MLCKVFVRGGFHEVQLCELISQAFANVNLLLTCSKDTERFNQLDFLELTALAGYLDLTHVQAVAACCGLFHLQ